MLASKSEENLESANLLYDNEKYNSSVHCSYYAVYQYLVQKNPGFEQNSHGAGSHNKLVNFYKREIRERKRLDYPKFKNSIDFLKESRSDADYNKVMITAERSFDCIRKCEVIKDIVNQSF